MKWTEKPHIIWGEGGREEGVHDLIRDKNMFPTKQWVSGDFSIIPPCGVTFGQWELYDGKDIERFDSLEAAQKHAETLTR